MSVFPLMGFSRHRLGMDGEGVTTLAAAAGCTLRCRYCLNPQCLDPNTRVQAVTPRELYDMLRVDDLYFRATNGGVVFGGGEPLLHAGFICGMRELIGDAWRITAETSLAVPEENVRLAASCIDEFIADIKDTDPGIYRRYTGGDGELALKNLSLLLELKGPERVTVRVPHIPGCNTPEDVRRSIEKLRAMGAARIDEFTYRVPKSL